MKAFVRNALNAIKKQQTIFDGSVIPARHLRLCGDDFKDDAYFLNSARKEADRLIEWCGLSKDSRLLDVGCGPGRLPIGIISRIETIENYQGIDVDKRVIDWCSQYISSDHSNFHFLRVDVENTRYNPEGEKFSNQFKLPFDDQAFDIIYLYSVFSHMTDQDVELYLREFKRLLSPEGKIFLTAFIEGKVPDMSINPPDYRRKKWKGPLHCVRFEKNYFNSILSRTGFVIDKFVYEAETHGQSALYLAHK
jgi:ubiquinone/menaquinone biosynthesis C-methylase UbiE